MDAIVLDGDQRPALAVTRSLGSRGIQVTVGSETEKSLSSCSEYCSQSFTYPSPYTNPDAFLERIIEYTANHPDAALFPITDVTLGEVLKRKNVLGNHLKIPLANYDQYMAASDKSNLFCLAKKLEIPTPVTLLSSEFKELEDLIQQSEKVGFPLVIKPARSRIRTEKGWIGAGVRYARDTHELRAVLKEELFRSFPFLIQERIEGPGIGVFLLMQNGNVLTRFAHRRIREKPPSGGVSVLCESIEAPPKALDAAVKLLEDLKWSGVAMVEFKWDHRDNTPKLMEVNARFWGSLQLAVSAGVDFPYLLFCLARGETVQMPKDYNVGLRLRWELGDLDHLLLRMWRNPSALRLPLDSPSRLSVLWEFVRDFFRPCVRNEVLRFDDPRPFVFEMKHYIKAIINSENKLARNEEL